MLIRRTISSGLALGLAFATAIPGASAQDPRGRKYKAPPETSHIEVLVLRDNNQKPIPNAAVVFHSVRDGKDEGNLEVKTNDQGKAIIDVIPTGSSVDVQVIADGFATFAGTYQVNEASRAIEIKMIKPRAQISTYIDTRGQPAQRPAGIQDPTGPVSTSTQPPAKAAPPATPLQTNPPNMHPDNQYPLEPATAPKSAPSTPSPAPPPTTPPLAIRPNP